MRARQVANGAAAAFLVGVASLVGYGAWALLSGPPSIPTEPLVDDLAEFVTPAGAKSLPTVVTGCTGDGSFPAYAERTFELGGEATKAEANLRGQATELGWDQSTYEFALGEYERGPQYLTITAAQTRIVVRVDTKDWC